MNAKDLSIRLQKAAEFVPQDARLADIRFRSRVSARRFNAAKQDIL